MHQPSTAEGYTVGQLARVLDTTPRTIRSLVRDGLVDGARDEAGQLHLGFPDLVLLRSAVALARETSPARVRRALAAVRDRLPDGTRLASVRVEMEGNDLVVHDGGVRFDAESGQGLLALAPARPEASVTQILTTSASGGSPAPRLRNADEWYELGLLLEENEQSGAEAAYRRALVLEPSHADAAINLGRLRHQAGDPRGAARLYVQALESRPEDVTAVFNLGVVLEDLGQPREAVAAYQQALSMDPTCADAHFNVARLYEAMGDRATAVRHLARYRQLTR